MAKIVNKYRVHCARRHIDAFVTEFDDGTFAVRCGFLRHCGEECPYLKNPNYKSPFRRAPKYEPK